MKPDLQPSTTQRISGRIPLLDQLRGLALLAMASYHFTWDLELFGYLEPGTATQGWWKIYARSIATSFLFLAGISLFLAHGQQIRWHSFLKRMAMVAGAAALISVSTWFAFPEGFIFFGILHNIAVASIIGLVFLRLPAPVTLAMALAVLVIPLFFSSPAFNTPLLAISGLAQAAPRSNDFVPLMPWLAPFLVGVAISGIAVRRGWFQRLTFSIAGTAGKLLSLAGKHSLAFYLVHQPVLIGIVYLASLVAPPPPADLAGPYMRSCQQSCVAQGNDAGMCERFCGCTLERLGAEKLLEPMSRGSLDETQSASVRELADQCTLIAQ